MLGAWNMEDGYDNIKRDLMKIFSKKGKKEKTRWVDQYKGIKQKLHTGGFLLFVEMRGIGLGTMRRVGAEINNASILRSRITQKISQQQMKMLQMWEERLQGKGERRT